jgi:hypothetical protein
MREDDADCEQCRPVALQRLNVQLSNVQFSNVQRLNVQHLNEQRSNVQRLNEQFLNEQSLNEPRLNDQRVDMSAIVGSIFRNSTAHGWRRAPRGDYAIQHNQAG